MKTCNISITTPNNVQSETQKLQYTVKMAKYVCNIYVYI